jgi:hypothetical protein
VPPLMVTGLSCSDVSRARQTLRRRGFETVKTSLVPAQLDAFVVRGGLLVWVLADTATRVRIASQRRKSPLTPEQAELLGQWLHKQRQAMFETDWLTIKLSNRAHPGYFFRLAHIVVWHDGDRSRLTRLLSRLEQDVADGLAFTPRQTRTVESQSGPSPEVGQTLWEMKCYGHPTPEQHPYSSLAYARPKL